jgi:RHS repeat-associated protein
MNILSLLIMLVLVFPVQNLFASQEHKSFLHSNNGSSNMAVEGNEYSLDQQDKGYRNFNKDTTAGLYYLHARYYDQNTRQFLTKDPAEMKNLYGYCVKDPVNHSLIFKAGQSCL